MPEVGGVGGGKVSPNGQPQISDSEISPVNQSNTQTTGVNTTVGQPGELGQPTGLPAPPLAPGQKTLPDVLAGRDPSQLLAAEHLRAAGGATETEKLLGLNLQPTILGAITPPPGNSEILRHLTPTMRRTIMRNLLEKQRERMRRLALALREERDRNSKDERSRDETETNEEVLSDSTELILREDLPLEFAASELGKAARMLDLLDELLAMQDYTISQMGTFSQG
jgi:hypothetical protein